MKSRKALLILIVTMMMISLWKINPQTALSHDVNKSVDQACITYNEHIHNSIEHLHELLGKVKAMNKMNKKIKILVSRIVKYERLMWEHGCKLEKSHLE